MCQDVAEAQSDKSYLKSPSPISSSSDSDSSFFFSFYFRLSCLQWQRSAVAAAAPPTGMDEFLMFLGDEFLEVLANELSLYVLQPAASCPSMTANMYAAT